MTEKGFELEDFRYDPNETSLEDFLTEWKSRVETAEGAGLNYSDRNLGFRLIKSLNLPNRKSAKILEHVSVLQCNQENNFLEMIETTVRQLEASEWNWEILKKKPRWKISTDDEREKNILEDCCQDFFHCLLQYFDFNEKKNICLISKRMYLRMNHSEESIRQWSIKVTNLNSGYYASKLKIEPYKVAHKDIYLDFTEYTGSPENVAKLVDDRTKSISGLDVNFLNTLLEARKTFEGVDSVTLENVKDQLPLITFLTCSQMTLKKLTLTNCQVDKKVLDLGSQVFSSLEHVVVVKNCTKSYFFRELLKIGRKTLKTLEVGQPSVYPFDVKVLNCLQFSSLQKVVIDLEGTFLNFHHLISTLEASTKCLREVRLIKAEKFEVDDNEYPLVQFPELKVFAMEITGLTRLSSLNRLHQFPLSMQCLTELVIEAVAISGDKLASSLEACSQTVKQLTLCFVHIFGPVVLQKKFVGLKVLSVTRISSSHDQQPMLALLANCGNELDHLRLGRDVISKTTRKLDVELRLSKLRKLSWSGKQNCLLENILQSSSATLLSLCLVDVDIDKIQVGEYVKILDLRECRGRGLDRVVRTCARSLESLCLASIQDVDFSAGAEGHIKIQFPKLKLLSFRDCQKISNISSVTGEHSPALETFTFEDCDTNLTNINMPGLKHVLLFGLNFGDTSALLTSCSTSLETLGIFDIQLLKRKYKFANLEYLSIPGSRVRGRQLAKFLISCQATLETLEIGGNITGLENLPWKDLNHLRHLHIFPEQPAELLEVIKNKIGQYLKIECHEAASICRHRLQQICFLTLETILNQPKHSHKSCLNDHSRVCKNTYC